MQSIPDALAPFMAWPNFIMYKLVPSIKKPGKFDKVPFQINGFGASTTNPAHWSTAPEVLYAFAQGGFSGIGFVFTADMPYFFLDIDNAAVNGDWSDLAKMLLMKFKGCAVELSQSRTGLHVFGRATKGIVHRNKDPYKLGLELYTQERFVALTGVGALGSVDFDASAAYNEIAALYFPPPEATADADWTKEPHPDWAGPEDDDELIRRALKAAARKAGAAFGDDVSFKALWEADAVTLGAKWPDGEKARPFDPTNADQSLANHLAFWTGKNCERMERLMRRSALYREKWEPEVHSTYLENTILKACNFTKSVYKETAKTDKPTPPPPPPPTDEQTTGAIEQGFTWRAGNETMVFPAQIPNLFAGCVYIESLNKIFHPAKGVIDKVRFDIIEGGRVFVMDGMGEDTSDSAWDAFTTNLVVAPPMAYDLCFRPEYEFGELVCLSGNRTSLNVFDKYECETLEGDPTPMLELLGKLLPDTRDQAILTNYIASFAQNLGHKFQWWPVLQGTEGNGKSFFIRVMTYIAGDHRSHLPNAETLAKGNQFNGWIDQKTFIGIEEIAVGHRRDFLEAFKATVTNDRLPLEKKGVDQFTGDNRVNGLLCTNHRDGVPITVDMRRYGVFFTAQQTKAHKVRDGMTGSYFPDLYDWFYGRGKYAAHGANYGAKICAHYFKNFETVAEMDPARLSTEAPATSSTGAAVEASLGKGEQEIVEAIAKGDIGFKGGWVSSVFLDRLLDSKRIPIPRTKRLDMMRALGYIRHPVLRDGRTNNAIQPDNTKPILYVKEGHLTLNMTTPAEVAAAYTKAQSAEDGTESAAAIAFSK